MTNSMTWQEQVAMDRERFIDGMVAQGFRLVHDDSYGLTSDAELRNETVRVVLENGFPYLPPSVYVEVPVRKSWHLENTGKLCLYVASERESRPWEDPAALGTRIDEWFEKNELGWADDVPVLDLDAYLDLPMDPVLVVFDHLDRYEGGHVTLAGTAAAVRITGQGRPSKKARRGNLAGFVTNIGELEQPIASLDAILDMSPDAQTVRHAIGQGRLNVLLVRYSRGGTYGAVALTFDPRAGTRRAPSASGDSRTFQLRAGAGAASVAAKHVYIIGAGALGSHIADGLLRAGLGRLTLRDGDIFLPGNSPRHIIAADGVAGFGKASALKAVLEGRLYSTAKLTANDTALVDPSEVVDLVGSDVLVVDATADGAVLSMLSDAAQLTGARFVTVCLQNEGRSMRVDIVPPLGVAQALEPTVLKPPTRPEQFEAGCGEPVSPTPPYAVAEGAAIAVRHIVGLLVDEPVHPSGELRKW